jgi:thioredoxin 1
METAAAHKSFAEIVAGNMPVLVGFYADWSDSWSTLKPVLDEIKKKWGEQIIILKIDSVKNPKIIRQYQVSGVPTLILFKNNTVCWRHSGVATSSTLNSVIQQNL